MGHSLNFRRDDICNATKIMARNVHNEKDLIVQCRRGSLGGKTAVACSGSLVWDRFRHAEGIDENFRGESLDK